MVSRQLPRARPGSVFHCALFVVHCSLNTSRLLHVRIACLFRRAEVSAGLHQILKSGVCAQLFYEPPMPSVDMDRDVILIIDD